MEIDCSNFVSHNRVQVWSYSKYFLLSIFCWDWTCTLQMILLTRTFQPNACVHLSMYYAGQFSSKFLFFKLPKSYSSFNLGSSTSHSSPIYTLLLKDIIFSNVFPFLRLISFHKGRWFSYMVSYTWLFNLTSIYCFWMFV